MIKCLQKLYYFHGRRAFFNPDIISCFAARSSSMVDGWQADAGTDERTDHDFIY